MRQRRITCYTLYHIFLNSAIINSLPFPGTTTTGSPRVRNIRLISDTIIFAALPKVGNTVNHLDCASPMIRSIRYSNHQFNLYATNSKVYWIISRDKVTLMIFSGLITNCHIRDLLKCDLSSIFHQLCNIRGCTIHTAQTPTWLHVLCHPLCFKHLLVLGRISRCFRRIL